jgi:NADH-quinone oxidoreductase subunit E
LTDTTFSPAAAPLAERLLEPAQEILARYPVGRERSALLPLLHLVQSVEGYVSPAGVAFCAEVLGINKAQVGAVATFYTMYKRRPTGDYLVSVCTNTMCNVLGGQEVYDTLTEHLGVGHDETTADGTITLEHAECLAACDYGPVMTVNYDFYDGVTPQSALGVVEGLRTGERPAPTRGARLCTLKEMSLQLAGFADPRAEAVADGPAGAPTLRGVTLAQQHGIAVAGFDPETPIPTTEREPAQQAVPAPSARQQAAADARGDGKVASAAKKVADSVKAAASAVAAKAPTRRTATRKAAAPAASAGVDPAAGEKTAAQAASTTRDVKAGDQKDPQVRTGETRQPDAATPAGDAAGTKTPAGGPPPASRGGAAAEAAGVRANETAGDAKAAGDAGVEAQARNLSDAAADGTKRGTTAADVEEK